MEVDKPYRVTLGGVMMIHLLWPGFHFAYVITRHNYLPMSTGCRCLAAPLWLDTWLRLLIALTYCLLLAVFIERYHFHNCQPFYNSWIMILIRFGLIFTFRSRSSFVHRPYRCSFLHS